MMKFLNRVREPRDIARILLGRPTRLEVKAKDTAAKAAKRAQRNARHEAMRLAKAAREAARLEAKQASKAARRERNHQARLAALPLIAPPRFAIDNIELTNRCPMRCVMCPRTNHMTRPQGFMTFDIFQRVIDELILVNPTAGRLGTYLHHFGESLLHPELDRFVAYAEHRGVRTMISVNPLAMKDAVIDRLIQSPPSYLMIALDGHDNESFARIRGVKNGYDLSVERLQRYLARKVKEKIPTHVEFSMVDFVENAESIRLLKGRWAAVEGIDAVVAKRFSAWDGSAAEINAYAPVPMTNEEARKHQALPSCELPWEKLSILWDGTVVPCCYDFDKKVVLGNIKEKTLSEIWNGEPMQALRAEFRSNRLENPLCRDCPKLYRLVRTADDEVPAALDAAADPVRGVLPEYA